MFYVCYIYILYYIILYIEQYLDSMLYISGTQ